MTGLYESRCDRRSRSVREGGRDELTLSYKRRKVISTRWLVMIGGTNGSGVQSIESRCTLDGFGRVYDFHFGKATFDNDKRETLFVRVFVGSRSRGPLLAPVAFASRSLVPRASLAQLSS